MTPYLAIFSARFRMLLQYRAAAIAGLGTQLFWGFIRVMIFEAFYRSSGAVQPMSLEQVVCYVWLGQACLLMLPWNTDQEIQQMVRGGNVAYEMLRPVDLYNVWFCRAIASRTAPTALRAIPMILLVTLVLPAVGAGEWALRAPASGAHAIAFCGAMAAALLLSAAFSVIGNTMLLWTLAGEGYTHVVGNAVMLASGMIVPLPMFPDWMRRGMEMLPFAGMIDTPFRLYSGNLPAASALPLIARQMAWVIALVLFGRLLLMRGRRHLIVQGG